MTDHKFTDEEVIKGLKCLIGEQILCKECAYSEINGGFSCKKKAATHALAIINRQKAEIESLQDERDGRIKSLAAAFNISEAEARVEAYIRSQKAESIKEFAERLCEDRVSNDPVVIAASCLLKEMTEEK